jgi:hypothetical protein
LISDRPETERARISALLDATPYRHLPLECGAKDANQQSLIRFKSAAATRWGCTHFIEPNAEQAIGIAAAAPHLLVTWWSLEHGCRWIIGAAADSDRSPVVSPKEAQTEARTV